MDSMDNQNKENKEDFLETSPEFINVSKNRLPRTEQIDKSGNIKSSNTPSTEAKQQENPYIISLDVGTTSLRSHVYDKNGSIKGSSSKRVSVIFQEVL